MTTREQELADAKPLSNEEIKELRAWYIQTSFQLPKDQWARLMATLTSSPPQAEGWKLVPREPSPEMQAEMQNLDGPLSRGQFHPSEYWQAIYDAAPPPSQETTRT